MEKTKPFGWCFIGAGTLAKNVAREILPSKRHKIVSVYARREENRSEYAVKYGAKAYASAAEAINADGVDGVYIVTPHNSHYEYAKLALELGKPVFCEKAFTVSAWETDELIALSREKKLYLAEAMWTWFAPVAHKVKGWLDDGEFGELKEVKINYHLDVRKYAPRVTDPMRAGGALLDIGVYPITYLYRLFGKPVKLVCTGTLENGIDINEDVTMCFENGLVATASISIADFKGFEVLRITGDKAKVKSVLFHIADKIKLVRYNGKNEKAKGSGGYLNEFDIVVDEIRGGLLESRLVPLSATSDVMHILDDCRSQLGLVYPFEKQ